MPAQSSTTKKKVLYLQKSDSASTVHLVLIIMATQAVSSNYDLILMQKVGFMLEIHHKCTQTCEKISLYG